MAALHVLAVTINDQVTPSKRPCIASQDVVFSRPSRVHRIAFRNNYTASVTIRATTDKEALMRKDRESLEGWVTILKNSILMPDPHSEDASQYWHSFGPDEMTGSFDHEVFVGVRILCYQPSPCWSGCGVTALKVWGDASPRPLSPKQRESASADVAAQMTKTKAVSAHVEALVGACVDLKRSNASFGVKLKQ